MARREGVETRIEGPWVQPLDPRPMTEVEFTQHLLNHVSGRRRWPVVVSLAVDVMLPEGMRE
jgi:hypothetical protein